MRFAVFLSLCVAWSGCGRDDVKTYRVAKTPDATPSQLPAGHPPMTGSAPGGLPDSGSPPGVKYQTPAGWTEVTPGPMRVASFNVKDAGGKQVDISIIPLPGMAGGTTPNVNRWRSQQLGLPAFSDAEVEQAAEKVTIAGEAGQLFDFSGKNPASGDPARILAAILNHDGVAWFFKAVGDDELVEAQKGKLVEFLKTVQFVAASAAATPPDLAGSGALPPGHPAVAPGAGAADSAPPVSHEGQPNWTVPTGWKEVSGGQFLKAKFLLAGDGGAQAAVNVSTSAGTGGGLASNLNRWRGQLGLPTMADDEVAKAVGVLKTDAGEAKLAEMTGTDGRTGQPTKLVGVVLSRGGETWFYKLMGAPAVVDSQKDAFTKFVTSVKY